MANRATVLLALIGVGWCFACQSAILRTVEVTRSSGRFQLAADAYLEASPRAVYEVLLDFEDDRYSRISEIYKESDYLPPDHDGTPLVYTRVEGCLMLYCRSMTRVERLEVVTPQFIRSTVLPERSDFKYASSEWTLVPEGDGTKVIYRMEMEPDFWLPPFVGPWFLKRTLLRGAPRAVDRIEELAQEVDDVRAARADAG